MCFHPKSKVGGNKTYTQKASKLAYSDMEIRCENYLNMRASRPGPTPM